MPSRSDKDCFQFRDLGYCTYGARCRYSHVTASNHHKKNMKKNKHQRQHRKTRFGTDEIAAFFAEYQEFEYKEAKGVVEEFYRMCDFFGWDKDDEERIAAHQAFKDAMVSRFNTLYGTDESDIGNWHKLCVAVNIDPLPKSIGACKAKIKKVHVNLVDLVDTSGKDVELFASLDKLRNYTIGNGKYFPKQSAYAGGVLKFLLREILS